MSNMISTFSTLRADVRSFCCPDAMCMSKDMCKCRRMCAGRELVMV